MTLSKIGPMDVKEGSCLVEGATLLLCLNMLGKLLDHEHMRNKNLHVHSLAAIHTPC